ncbi:MAG: hypothetical protein SFW62_06050 [Alphaproteobacteria bacterium]|nr:hypothetical protein [Alphaproteobacteria bacterium]
MPTSMPNHLKKHGFLAPIERIFTRGNQDAYALIHFREPEQEGDESWPALESPDGWSAGAASLLADEAVCKTIPTRLKAVEENTVPSWLWRRTGNSASRVEEFSARQVFDRVVGSAAYAGWKQGLFASENEARAFFDETRSLLVQRMAALEPCDLADLGLAWAYGIENSASGPDENPKTAPRVLDIPNVMIDAAVRGSADQAMRAQWQKIWAARGKASAITLQLSDIAADWGAAPSGHRMRAMLDIMAFRHNDGSVNIEALRHATRLLVLLLDLHGDRAGPQLDIGFCNLSPLLMALALPYDSEAGRSIAAAVSAVITAEAYAASAELAGLRGPSAAFAGGREIVLRALRNHRRAAYGDKNDYEKISVLPAPLVLESCPDLALVAAVRRRWDEVLELVRQHGLRHTQVTALSSSPELMLFMQSAAQGIEPVTSLAVMQPGDADLVRKDIHPSVTEALARLGYDATASRSIVRHVMGTGTLEHAPSINHMALHARGFDAGTIEKIENYLPYVGDIRLACTPWIVGEDFCRRVLKVPAAKMKDARFELLRHLGFSGSDIAAANAYCYGHGSVQGAKELRSQHIFVFARAADISSEARIRMAAAVQGFISGDVGLALALPANSPVEKNEFLLLSAWRQGLKSLSILQDVGATPLKKSARKSVQKSRASFLHTKKPAGVLARKPRLKAGSSLVTLGRGRARPSSGRDKRR